uniref:Uncharacterized protein n=1 Tax=Micrurus lemniscatus lemniscatus TaxID=129467 RepID=A0A2D4GZK8_MICLE
MSLQILNLLHFLIVSPIFNKERKAIVEGKKKEEGKAVYKTLCTIHQGPLFSLRWMVYAGFHCSKTCNSTDCVNAVLPLCNKKTGDLAKQMYQSMVISHIAYMESLHLEAQRPGILVSREQ